MLLVQLLYCIFQLYYTYTNIHENIINCNDDFNKQTNTLFFKNISLTLYSQNGDVCCVWEMSWRQVILTQVHLLTIAAFLSHLGLGCSTVGHWGQQNPQSASWFSNWHLVSNCLKPSRHLVILFSNAHLLPLFFHLFTQVHVLIDGSVKGQYITQSLKGWYKDWRLGNGISGDHRKYGIIEIDQNTEKSPGDLRRLAIT